MRVLFDTNVMLDVLLRRGPDAVVAARLMALVECGQLEGALCATTVTTIYYVAAKIVGRATALEAVRAALGVFGVAPVDHPVLCRAVEMGFADFEDAVLHEAARAAGVSAVVTRDATGFAAGTLAVYTPADLLARLASPPA